MYDIIFIILLVSALVIGYMGWRFVFPFDKQKLLVSLGALASVNLVLTFMMFDSNDGISKFFNVWIGLTFSTLVIGLVVFIIQALRNNEDFMRGVNMARRGEDQIGRNFFKTETRQPAPSSERKSKSKREDDNSLRTENRIETKTPKREAQGPKMKRDSTARNCCYNCQYWTGNRQLLSAAGNFIEYEDVSAKCAPGGGRQNANMNPRATCNKFSRQFG